MRNKTDKCRYFTGIQNKTCEIGIEYPVSDLPCLGDHQTCDKHEPFSAEELAAKKVAMDRHMDLMRRGLSGCCEAEFNTNQVLTSGKYKGHGPRFCSKCGKLAFMV
jgi:hypothetical protein